jgi:hypothetical protein
MPPKKKPKKKTKPKPTQQQKQTQKVVVNINTAKGKKTTTKRTIVRQQVAVPTMTSQVRYITMPDQPRDNRLNTNMVAIRREHGSTMAETLPPKPPHLIPPPRQPVGEPPKNYRLGGASQVADLGSGLLQRHGQLDKPDWEGLGNRMRDSMRQSAENIARMGRDVPEDLLPDTAESVSSGIEEDIPVAQAEPMKYTYAFLQNSATNPVFMAWARGKGITLDAPVSRGTSRASILNNVWGDKPRRQKL